MAERHQQQGAVPAEAPAGLAAYRVLRELGRGQGVLTQEALGPEGRVCILKQLSLARAGDWKRMELFKREARTLAHLEHPRVPALLDYFELSEGEACVGGCLVLEKVPGRNLAEHVRESGPVSEAEAVAIASQVLAVLDYLHAFNPPVVHRDLKPSNLMRDEQGQIWLIDFGGVQQALAVGAGGSTLVGTYGYMAPEQFAGRAVPGSDLYGLGTTLIYLLSGREPADLPQRDLLIDFRSWVECSARFAHWIEQLILPRPEQRFASASQALEVLLDILPAYRSLGAGTASAALTETSPRPGTRKELRAQLRLDTPAELPAHAASEAETTHQLTPGTILAGRYRLLEVLGSGDATVTYAGERLSDGARVAVRELHFERLSSWKSYELFERELRVLAKLRHPALPRLLEHFELREQGQDRFYLISERIEARSLAHRLAEGWRPLESELRGIADQLLQILEFLQTQEPVLIHRDIKPSNILLDDQGKVWLIDFGAVREAVRLQSGGSTVIGTYGYMAPEQFVGKAVPRSDLYGLGTTLLHLLSGRPPCEIPQQGLRLQFVDLVNCSRQLYVWLERMVAPAPEQRYESPWQAREALQRLEALPVISERTRQLASAAFGPDEPAVSIREDVEGLTIRTLPIYYDHRKLLPLLLSGNALALPILISMAGAGLLLAPLIPLGSWLGYRHLKALGETYETCIHLDACRFSYTLLQYHREPDGRIVETRIEHFEYPISMLTDFFLDHREIDNRLGFRINPSAGSRQPFHQLTLTAYPLAGRRRQAECLVEYLREALAYYRKSGVRG